MPSLAELRANGMLTTSKLIKKILYGANSYYGANVQFGTTEKTGDFATHATTGKALALLIAHKMHTIFVQEYDNDTQTQPFVCHELSGGNGQLAYDILSIIKIMADKETSLSKPGTWSRMWQHLKLRTYEISKKLCEEQNAKLAKFNDADSADPEAKRYESINAKASKKRDAELVYLCFSNEIFDALPVDIIYRSKEDYPNDLYIQMCIPIVARAELATLGIAPLPLPPEYEASPVEAAFEERILKLQSGAYVIPPLSAVDQLSNVEYIPFYVPLDAIDDLKYKEDIRKYIIGSGLQPGCLTTYSAPYVKLLNILSNKNNLHHMHFDYFNICMAQFRQSIDYFRQYPANDYFLENNLGRSFAYTNQSVDITYNPELHIAAQIFADRGLDFVVAHQAAPYVLQASDFREMIEVLRASEDPEIGGERIVFDIAKFITESSSDFKFFEAGRNLKDYSQTYSSSTLAPVNTDADMPAKIALQANTFFSPFMSPLYNTATFLSSDPVGQEIAKTIDSNNIEQLCVQFKQRGTIDDQNELIKALEEQPLFFNKSVTIDGEITTPWCLLMQDESVSAETIQSLCARPQTFMIDYFAKGSDGRLLVENETIDIEKRKLLLDVIQYWQFCLHLAKHENFQPGVDHLCKLYKELGFNSFSLVSPNAVAALYPELRLDLAPADILNSPKRKSVHQLRKM